MDRRAETEEGGVLKTDGSIGLEGHPWERVGPPTQTDIRLSESQGLHPNPQVTPNISPLLSLSYHELCDLCPGILDLLLPAGWNADRLVF